MLGVGLFLCSLLLLPAASHSHVSRRQGGGEDNEGATTNLPDQLESATQDDAGGDAGGDDGGGGGDGLDDLANAAENELDRLDDNFILTLKNLSRYLPINVEYAVEKGRECDIIRNNKQFYQRVPLIISAVLIVLGIIFGFFGYRLIKIVLFLIGFLIGFAALYLLITGLTYSRPEHWIPYMALGVAIVAGLLAGLLTICIYYIGIFLAGGSIGFLVTWFILSAINVPFFREHIYVPVLISLAVAIILGIITLILQKWFFMLGTAVLGGFIVVWGFDYYLELGSMIYYLFLFAEHRSNVKPCWYSWIIIPLFIVLIFAGLLIQVFITGRKYDHKKEMKGVCCGLCKKKKKDTKSAPDGKANYMKLKSVEK